MHHPYFALIPAYKPTTALPQLVLHLRELGFSVVIVDDGSGPEYAHIFDACDTQAKLLTHEHNKGKGHALKTGLSYIARIGDESTVIVTVDADGQHRGEDALAISRLADQAPNALVLGSRTFKGDVPIRSRLGNHLTRVVYRISTGLGVHDTQTGLRAFHSRMIPTMLDIPGERYEYEMNVLLHFARSNIQILEHEIETVYIDNNASSHFNPFKDSLRIYKEILKFSTSSLIGFLADYLAYSLLFLFTQKLKLSNVLARVISASINFTLNRRFVFKSKAPLWRAAVKYALLAIGILICNTLVLELLVTFCGIHQMLAKLLTELLFFILSWLVQRLVVFKNQTGGDRQ